MAALVGIGRARLRTVGLSPQSIARSSEARVPGRPTFGGMSYQKTGRGEEVTVVEAVTMPHVIGGMDAVGWLLAHHKRGDTVNYFRLGANFLGELVGPVVIRTHDIDESHLHPFSGVGRRVEVALELVHV